MKCDVFISYSRSDIKVAESLCSALAAAGVDFWIDRNIHGSANFLTEITGYISSCKVVLFIASAASAKSEWTQREILFALKHHKKILPYRIGDFSFDDNIELDFIFTNVQWIESESEVITSLEKLGYCSQCMSHVPNPVPVKIFKIGDYYNDGVREGVVFEVSDDGKHGKIVSMIQSKDELEWASDDSERWRYIGADSQDSGDYNMEIVKSIPGWQSKYPAFKWCADLGEGWYLPSTEELLAIYRNKEKLNPKLRDKIDNEWYWSSMEMKEDESRACYVSLTYGYTGSTNKNVNGHVRAVHIFSPLYFGL